jgi:hypothetical protein
MRDGDLPIECGERRSQGRAGVAVHEHTVGSEFFDDAVHTAQHARGQIA